MGRVDGKVALITGAARGMGRSHAVRLAEEGADIVAVDLCEGVSSVPYPAPTQADLEETARLVEGLGRRIVWEVGDVRRQEDLDALVARAKAELGGIDIVSANAGISTTGLSWELDEVTWREMIDVNLTGVWQTTKAVIPAMIEAGRGGSIVLTSSLAGTRGMPNASHYVAAKFGVVGLMRSLANELGPHGIRVNAVLPGNVATPMVQNEATYRLFRPDLEDPTSDDIEPILRDFASLEVSYLDPRDVSDALLWLSSDEGRYVTGVALPVDAGWANK